MNSAEAMESSRKHHKKGMPNGLGYAMGTIIAIAAFIVFSITLKNLPMGVAWFASGYAVGFTLEGENQKPFSPKQKRLAASSVISGGISLVLSILLFNVAIF
jgi:hypothetical protein